MIRQGVAGLEKGFDCGGDDVVHAEGVALDRVIDLCTGNLPVYELGDETV